MKAAVLSLIIATFILSPASKAQYLDPSRTAHTRPATARPHPPEQFIWTANDAAALNPAYQAKVRGQQDKIDPHYFRHTFTLQTVPAAATFYLAGPRAAKVFLNGQQILHIEDDGASGKGSRVYSAPAASALHTGRNILAIGVVRGHSSLHTAASPRINQVTYGEVIAAKIVPAALAIDAPPIAFTNPDWRSVLKPSPDWSKPDFDDSTWPKVQSLGPIGSSPEFLQWSADAGLYAWPGYSGISSFLETFTISPIHQTPDPAQPNTFLIDFGKELSGRIHLISTAPKEQAATIEYGESAEEAQGHSYLGPRRIVIAPHAEAYGPKSAFRFARLIFDDATDPASIKIDAEAIAYPVQYLGSFESSDPLLNRIWETGAYTAHLCMQDSIWDGVKRDRGRWMGDLDVTGRVISSVFADRTLMESTLTDLLGSRPVTHDINTIAGYSALWITGQADFYRHLGDRPYLESIHAPLLELLAVMNKELSPKGLFTNPDKHKIFVDWSADLSSDTPEARATTHFEFLAAYQQAAYLLDELNDSTNAQHARAQATALLAAAQHSLRTPSGTYGPRWQTNAFAVVADAVSPTDQSAIWSQVLSTIDNLTPSSPVITPYNGFYVLSAMARLNHRPEALAWMRHYWGGMLDEGATSFWEAYDPRWPKQDFHKFLEADNKKGYYVSLAHGWSSGPTAWLMEEVLGIHPTVAGFRETTIRPDLAGLAWAKGSEPTPHGLIKIDLHPHQTTITLPPHITAHILIPTTSTVRVNGQATPSTPAENNTRRMLTLTHAGTYRITD